MEKVEGTFATLALDTAEPFPITGTGTLHLHKETLVLEGLAVGDVGKQQARNIAYLVVLALFFSIDQQLLAAGNYLGFVVASVLGIAILVAIEKKFNPKQQLQGSGAARFEVSWNDLVDLETDPKNARALRFHAATNDAKGRVIFEPKGASPQQVIDAMKARTTS